MNYCVKESEEDAQVINIVGNNYNEQFENLDLDKIEIMGLGEHQYVKFIVVGDVYDFALYNLNYADSNIENSERILEKYLGNISNVEVIIETTLAEGLPSESVRWKDSEGNLYEDKDYRDCINKYLYKNVRRNYE